MSQPAMGMNTKTNSVSFALKANMVISANRMVSGSRISISNTLKKERCTSETSVVTRDIVSPFLLLAWKLAGKEISFL